MSKPSSICARLDVVPGDVPDPWPVSNLPFFSVCCLPKTAHRSALRFFLSPEVCQDVFNSTTTLFHKRAAQEQSGAGSLREDVQIASNLLSYLSMTAEKSIVSRTPGQFLRPL